jgi:uncharacterized protein (DUF111 family)
MAQQEEQEPMWNMPPGGNYHAHFDCFSGVAGDMMLAACLDAAEGELLLPYIQFCLERGMPELKGEFSLSTKRVWRSQTGSIAANYLTVKSRYEHAAAPVPQPDNSSASSTSSHDHHHDHHATASGVETTGNFHAHEAGMNHGHSHAHDSSSINGHDHHHAHGGESRQEATSSHDHSHSHQNGNGNAGGPLRNLPQIRQMLQDAPIQYIPNWAKDMAIAAFTELAKAEALTHGAASSDSVHFHEVGAVDSIVDTVGTCLALYCLGVTTVSCSRLPLGEGTVWTDHGLLPVPAPATLRLLVGMPTCPGPPGVTGELVTPTAAALLKVLTTLAPTVGTGKLPGRAPCFTIRKVGIGAGTKDFVKHPNILRLLVGDQVVVDGRQIKSK